jgi:hypothetical protein
MAMLETQAHGNGNEGSCMGEVTIERCPVCGRKPKIKIVGDCIRVQCKPWYCRKAHRRIMVEVRDANNIFDVSTAISLWNMAAECANLPVW